MKLIVDGDGCPVIDICIRVTKSFGKDILIICDTSHNLSRYDVEAIVVSKGNDAADFIIINKVDKGDIVVTQDYGLAAMVLSKGASAINQNGLIYSNNNIDQLLFTRHISKKVRKSGGRTKGPKKRTKADNEKFEIELINLLKSKGYKIKYK
ncbi:YaiI/YqxD family protein [Romboutsia sp. Marseille-P6047]|uniref:YaiI/YqxD family protein n=1 Tax=Romboutsia sp. Marseille-P6047 TaxID=2161817 RepID=UPI000F0573A9|nr:YaiI/YqxD family protein [Romboutsia sp. Marseille-P6047]